MQVKKHCHVRASGQVGTGIGQMHAAAEHALDFQRSRADEWQPSAARLPLNKTHSTRNCDRHSTRSCVLVVPMKGNNEGHLTGWGAPWSRAAPRMHVQSVQECDEPSPDRSISPKFRFHISGRGGAPHSTRRRRVTWRAQRREKGARPVAARGKRGQREGVGACRAEIAEIANGGSVLSARASSGRFSAARLSLSARTSLS